MRSTDVGCSTGHGKGVMIELSDTILDCAIVGGGVAGTYCAWRLSLDESLAAGCDKPRLALFEGSDRIGGRLLSLTPPGMPHVIAEMGGMDFLSTHTFVRSLITNKLRLPYTSATLTGSLRQLVPENIAYLRRRHLRLADLTDPTQVPYNLSDAERGSDPGTLISYALEQLLPGVTSLTGPALETRLQSTQIEGRPVYGWGFWNLLLQVLSQEAYDFARDSGGFDFTLLNSNAVAMIRKAQEFPLGVQICHLSAGYDQLPLTLYRQFQAAGGQGYLGYRLKAVNTTTLADGSDGFELLFYANSTGWGPDAGGEPTLVYARSVILAMPRRALELVDQTGVVLGEPRVRQMLTAVTPIPMLKIFLCYANPWWEAAGVKHGRAVSDLPLRQNWYWGIEGDQPGADPDNRNALLMAAFADTMNVEFWEGLLDVDALDAYCPQPNPYRDLYPGSDDWLRYRLRATQPLVQEVQRQLGAIHNLPSVPPPYDVAFMDWRVDPYGGGSNYWDHHISPWQYAPRIAQPVPAVPLYICGEAYSNTQGWVEGALETAEAVLQNHFHLAPPDWATQG